MSDGGPDLSHLRQRDFRALGFVAPHFRHPPCEVLPMVFWSIPNRDVVRAKCFGCEQTLEMDAVTLLDAEAGKPVPPPRVVTA